MLCKLCYICHIHNRTDTQHGIYELFIFNISVNLSNGPRADTIPSATGQIAARQTYRANERAKRLDRIDYSRAHTGIFIDTHTNTCTLNAKNDNETKPYGHSVYRTVRCTVAIYVTWYLNAA